MKSIQIGERKERTKKFFGWVSSYTPEEIIVAAGMIPFRITGSSYPLSLSKTYFSGNISSFIQSCLEGALRKEYDFLKGVIIGGETDAMKRLYDAWIHFGKADYPVYIFDIPKNISDTAPLHYKESISSFIKKIEADFNVIIDEHKIIEAIKICSHTRELLSKLNDMRKSDNCIINAVMIAEICKLSVSGDKVSFNAELNLLLEELIKNGNGDLKVTEHRPRLVLTGSSLVGTELLSIIDEAGAKLVCEDVDDKLGYFKTFYQIEGDDARLSIAKSYLNKSASATISNSKKRIEHILRLVNEFKANGVVYHVLKFDDPYLFEFPDIKDELNKKGIPLTKIETEVGNISEGQIKTRIQAFMDTISIC